MSSHLNKALHVVFSDHHFPYHDRLAIREPLSVVKSRQPGVVHLLGDIADCYAISRHRRDPQRKTRLQEEMDETHGYLVDLRRVAGDARIVYSEGNHEERLTKYLMDQAPELHGLRCMNIPAQLGLKDLGIEWCRNLKPYRIGDWWFTHGDSIRKHSAYTARAKSEQVGGNVIIGHTHRLGMSCSTTWGQTHIGLENGCLCLLTPEYIQGT